MAQTTQKKAVQKARAELARWIIDHSTLTAAGTIVLPPKVVEELQAIAAEAQPEKPVM